MLTDLVSPKKKINVIREDPPDNRILGYAQEGNAKYVASGDEHLLKLGKFKKIRIVAAAKLLEILKNQTRTK